MFILLVGVVYWVYRLWGGHRRVEYVQDFVGLDGVWFCYLFGGCCEGNPGLFRTSFLMAYVGSVLSFL